jgi:hypothetical protein
LLYHLHSNSGLIAEIADIVDIAILPGTAILGVIGIIH